MSSQLPSPLDARPSTPPSDDEVLVRVEGVSKKFCRSLKKSLWYGVCDIAGELLPGRKRRETRDEGRELSDRSAQNISRSSLATGLSTPASASSDPRPLDSAEGLRPSEFFAVKDVSFELRRGECLGLIGHNGAGKTTLLKMLNGLIKPDAGSITMRGRVGALIALGAGFNPILTGRENIYINGSVLGLTKKEIDAKIDEIIDFAEIRDAIDMPVQNYSSGMAVRLGFAVAATMEPDILIIDEVLAVGDTSFRIKCYNTIKKLLSKTAVIFVSHSMFDIERVCSEVFVLNKGHASFHGDKNQGISVYNSHAIKNDKTNDAETEFYIYNGLEKVEITNLESINQIKHTDILLGLKIQCNNPIHNAKIRMVFFDKIQSETPIAEWDSGFHNQFYDLKIGENCIKAEIKNISLRSGEYCININMMDSDGRGYCFHTKNTVPIQMHHAVASGPWYRI